MQALPHKSCPAVEHARSVMEQQTVEEHLTECENTRKGVHNRIVFSWFFVAAWAALGLWFGASNALQIGLMPFLAQEAPAYAFKTEAILTKHTFVYVGVCSYIGWAMFWGSIIVRPLIRRFVSSLFVFGNGLIDLLLRIVGIWLFSELILIPVIGTLVGGLGGSLYMFLKHMKLETEYRTHIEHGTMPEQVASSV